MKRRTKRFRGSVMTVAAGAVVIRADASSAAEGTSVWVIKQDSSQ